MKRINKCISCFGIIDSCFNLGKIPLVNNFKSKPQLKKYDLSMGLCRKCKLFQIEKNIDPKNLFSDYAHISAGSQSNLKHLKDVFNFINKKLKINNKTKILEIGSNDGSLLGILKNKTKNIVGVDPARNLVKKIKDDYLNVIPDFFNNKTSKRIKTKHGLFDVIVALNVIPHTCNLNEVINSVSNLMKPDGHFIMEGAYFFDTIYKGKFDTIYHEHVSSFTVTSIKNVLENFNLKLHYVDRISTQGGSIRIIAKKKTNSKQYLKILKIEKKFLVDKISTYKKVGEIINNKISEIKKNFEVLSKVKKVIFLGAPARGVVIANVCNFNAKRIAYAIDDSKTKENKFFPGYSIRVKSWNQLKKNSNFNFLILSWNYNKEILGKLGKLVKHYEVMLPLPKNKFIKR